MVGVAALAGFAVMLLLTALGVPIVAAIGLGCIVIIQQSGTLPPSLFATSIFSGIESFALLAIPLYVLTGDAITETGLSNRLLEFADSITAGLRTGVGSSTILGCGLFASISGSNSSDAAVIGRITHGNLKEYGYPGPYASALVASGASTGILIPPSITYIISGTILGISTSDLFIAGFVPGMLVLLSVLATNVVVNHRRSYESEARDVPLAQKVRSLWEAKFALAIPVIILGGIYSGIFTPTEAAAVAVVATLAIGAAQGTLTLGDFPRMYEQSALINGTVTPIIAVAIVLSQIFSTLGLPALLVEALTASVEANWLIVLVMLAIFLFSGALMETTPNILVLGPLLLPVATAIGMDPIHFTVFMNTALAVGFITPPIGLNLYVMSGVTDESILPIAREAIPYAIAMVLVVLLIGYSSTISTVGI